MEKEGLNGNEKSAINLFREGNTKEGFEKLGKKTSKAFLKQIADLIPFGELIKDIILSFTEE